MKEFISITKALADENRTRALLALRQRELCLCQLIELLRLAPSTVSKHMSILRQANLVVSRKQGRWMYYRLQSEQTLPEVQNALNWAFDSLAHSTRIIADTRHLESILQTDPQELCRRQCKNQAPATKVESKEIKIDTKPETTRRRTSDAGVKMKILFLCTGNSCRSQMAEGWVRHLKSDGFEPYSAGIETHGLNPYAVKVMAEAGVDISQQKSQHVDEFADVNFDLIVTVCSHADQKCPAFSQKTKVIHVGFDDPPKLAAQATNEQEALNVYRRVRDEIKAYIETLSLEIVFNEPRP